ncbi:hypothetical protein E2C01_013273 [Portunus trituberculatus]|uniref:Uncharacterized protein n=1 Tax=Portunus trituberculatus TaxID=210409 RepID=A0A5B7DGK8_PORTR|nr:hypothetical protein [Portunus trituberculatus]
MQPSSLLPCFLDVAAPLFVLGAPPPPCVPPVPLHAHPDVCTPLPAQCQSPVGWLHPHASSWVSVDQNLGRYSLSCAYQPPPRVCVGCPCPHRSTSQQSPHPPQTWPAGPHPHDSDSCLPLKQIKASVGWAWHSLAFTAHPQEVPPTTTTSQGCLGHSPGKFGGHWYRQRQVKIEMSLEKYKHPVVGVQALQEANPYSPRPTPAAPLRRPLHAHRHPCMNRGLTEIEAAQAASSFRQFKCQKQYRLLQRRYDEFVHLPAPGTSVYNLDVAQWLMEYLLTSLFVDWLSDGSAWVFRLPCACGLPISCEWVLRVCASAVSIFSLRGGGGVVVVEGREAVASLGLWWCGVGGRVVSTWRLVRPPQCHTVSSSASSALP